MWNVERKVAGHLTGENEGKGKNPDGLWSWSRESSGSHRVNRKIHFQGVSQIGSFVHGSAAQK